MLPIGLLSLVLFVELGIIAKSGPLPIDSRVAIWFKEHRTPTLVQWAQVFSALTTPIIVFSVIIVLLLFLNYWTRSWYPRDFIPLALVLTSTAIEVFSRGFFGRSRPWAGLTTLYDFEPSYPSSHTALIAAAGCALLFFAGKRQFLILMTGGFVTCIIGLVGLTLGVNWFTDIIGSFLLSLGLLIIFFVIDDWCAERERIAG